MIPIGYDFTATARGSIVKRVECERCRGTYFYVLRRVATGKGHSPFFLMNQTAAGNAETVAYAALARRLAKGCEPVRCPHCNWFQAAMVAVLRWRRFGWVNVAACVTAAVGIFGFCIWAGTRSLRPDEDPAIFLVGLVAPVALGLTLWAVGKAQAKAYNPNALPPNARLPGRRPPLAFLDFDTAASAQ